MDRDNASNVDLHGLSGHQIHLHLRLLAVEDRTMLERLGPEVSTQKPIHDPKDVPIELGGDTLGVVVGGLQDRHRFHQVEAQ